MQKIILYFRPITSFDPTAMPIKSTPKWSHFADFFYINLTTLGLSNVVLLGQNKDDESQRVCF